MSPSAQPLLSFYFIEGSNPVFVYTSAEDAKAFAKSFKGAEIYSSPTHVFLPKPQGLESIRGGQGQGTTAFLFHHNNQAEVWLAKLNGAGTMQHGTAEGNRTVWVGSHTA